MSDVYKAQGGRVSQNGPGTADFRGKANPGRELKDKASDLTDSVTQVAKDQAAGLSTAAKEIAADATDKVKSVINDQKAAGADYLGAIAGAVQRAAGEFDSEVPQAAQYIRQAAGQLESVANAVRERDVRELLGEVQDFARRQPTLFFGGAVILGFAALRFFKSSASGSRASSSRANDAEAAFSRYSEPPYAPGRAY